ncbi:major facilitator superfamily domain-containing protein [Immersiella caudata]|uniref:Major facilitator superfamily domain-containing protein n=1 Tax=Immersiella caudata TaxID=314043 RepID=A0AA39TVE2_9PEZI|nr:major facilitator superfamily domain-containing protein [Immersiella caudata]
MFLAAKYAKKKYKERQQRNTEATAELEQLRVASSGSRESPTSTPIPQSTQQHQHAQHNGATLSPVETYSPGRYATSQHAEKESPEERAEKKRRRVYRYKIIFGLFMPFTLQALDTTIIASALPFIATDFGQIGQLNWIITSFNLTAAAFLPFWAQIADIYGRFSTLLTGVAIISIGSAICTGAPTTAFGILLLGRALQGVGASGINICVRTILADRVDLAEYAKNWTIFAIFSAVGFAIGPVAGGYLTKVNWRWCFGINLPVAAVAVVLAFVLLKGELLGAQPLPELEETEHGRKRVRDKETKRGRFFLRLATIDYGGQSLFLWGIGLLVLALTWAGGQYAWDSAGVVAPLVTGGVLTVVWLWYEYAMAPGRIMARVFPLQRAMIPWELITQRDMGLLFVVNFVMGVAMFAVMYFMDLYFTLVRNQSSEAAGLSLLWFLSGLGPGAFSANFFMNIWPRQTQPTILLATVTASVGITVLAWATEAERIPVIYGMMALTGYGVGLSFNPGSLHALAYFPTMTAPIQCLVTFANPFGGTVGLTLMSTVFSNKSGEGHSDPKAGIMWAFIAVIPILWSSVLTATFMGNVSINPAREGGHDVVNGAWMWSFVTRRNLEKTKMIRGELGQANGTGAPIANGEPRRGLRDVV